MTTSPSKGISEQHQGKAKPDNDLSIPQGNTNRPIWEVVVEIGARIPNEEWEKVPSDASINYKHYLYGTPKKDA